MDLERGKAYRITARRGEAQFEVDGIFELEYRAADPSLLVFRHLEPPMPAFGFPQGFIVPADEVVSIKPTTAGET